MNVLKFGGTSVGSIPALMSVKDIIEARQEPVIVVVSALGGLTDRLIAAAKSAAGGIDTLAETDSFRKRHSDIIQAVVPEHLRPQVSAEVNSRLDELGKVYDELRQGLPLDEAAMDRVVAQGERMSSVIVTAMLADKQAIRVDALDIIRTRIQAGRRHNLDAQLTAKLVKEKFLPLEGNPVIVVPGFIARDADDLSLTNLGRGGSDFTAAILAANLGANQLEIWTDVDGFMTADPRSVSKAMVVDRMSMVEAMELCNYGAKVIYPPTIYPVFHAGIPIVIKNTFNPGAPGTFISESPAGDDLPVKGVTAIKDASLVSVSGRHLADDPALNARIFNAMGRHGIDIFLVAQPGQDAVAFVVKGTDGPMAEEVLRREFAVEASTGMLTDIRVTPALATLAVVGAGINGIPALADKIFAALNQAGVTNVDNVAASSKTALSFVVGLDALNQALNTIHNLIFRPRPVMNPQL